MRVRVIVFHDNKSHPRVIGLREDVWFSTSLKDDEEVWGEDAFSGVSEMDGIKASERGWENEISCLKKFQALGL